jgi:hypothetical protein
MKLKENGNTETWQGRVRESSRHMRAHTDTNDMAIFEHDLFPQEQILGESAGMKFMNNIRITGNAYFKLFTQIPLLV